jgi:tetratricopeptide (TPR) repeat protein
VTQPGATPSPRRRRLHLGVAALVLLPAALVLGGWGWYAYHLRAARQVLERYDLDTAQQHLERCLAVWSGTDVEFLTARTARRRGAFDDAERHLDTCRRRHYQTDAVALEHVLLRVQQGQFDDVEQSVRSLVEQNHPDASFILEALARGYVKTFRQEEAIDCLTLLLQREPKHVPALVLLAESEARLKLNEQARADSQKAVDLAPERADVRVVLAGALWRLGQVREAVGHYEVLRRQQPDSADALVGLALCRQDLGEFDEARAVLDDLLARHPDFVPGLVERARVAYRLGDVEGGEHRARQAVERAPYDADAARVLSLCLDARGQTEEADEHRRRWQQLEADGGDLTRLTWQLNESPRDPALHCRLGVLLLRLGREEAGAARLRTALAYDPGCEPAHRALADYYERTHQPDLAARHRRQADARP